ncbi:MAG: hypothetical protein P1T08_06140 [Acidimicrobiia bacterium]|nr:hypothetical protein [Acidimicrobiia bacterium]
MTERVLVGPFLTRNEAARRAGLAARELPLRLDLLRIGGRGRHEAYFAFQFDSTGIRRDLGSVVLLLRGSSDDLTIADWLVKKNLALLEASPLTWLNRGGALEPVLMAAEAAGTSIEGRLGSTAVAARRVDATSPPRTREGRPQRGGLPPFARPISSH